MLAHPKHWSSQYPGSDAKKRQQQQNSNNNRIRYFWPVRAALAAVEALMRRLAGQTIPETLISQQLARLYPAVVTGELRTEPRALCLAAIGAALDPYYAAVL